ncbi:MAG: hypothetical protein Q9163_000106 [Psora crenata]
MRRAARILLFFLVIFVFATYSSFRLGNTEKRLPQFRSQGDQAKTNPSLDFKPVPRALLDVHNSTLGVRHGHITTSLTIGFPTSFKKSSSSISPNDQTGSMPSFSPHRSRGSMQR